VREAIHAEAGDQSERNHLLGQLKLRLDRNDMYADLAKVPAEILIARIFRELDLAPDWERWQGESWLDGSEYAPHDAPDAAVALCPICRRPPIREAGQAEPEREPICAAAGSDPPPRSG
jgi:hypothetical protein